jgi:hypothetical protein
MSEPKNVAVSDIRPLTIEQLEFGLRTLTADGADIGAFWNENIEPFRVTLMHAIRDTSAALLSRDIPLLWKIELESELKELVRLVELADRHISSQASRGRSAQAFPPGSGRIH